MVEAETPQGREAAEELFTSHIAELEAGGEERLAELCEEHSEHADALRELYEEWRSVDDLFEKLIPDRGTISVDLAPLLGSLVGRRGEGSSSATSSSFEALEAIRERLASEKRYDVHEEFARGGMGAILRVFDRNIRRDLAMKVMLRRGLSGKSQESAAQTRAMGRFLDEAQITGQLEHPGIVPVHELGVDEGGQVYFTMKLVQGEELGEKYDKVHEGDKEWTTTRALSVLLRVCEAMSYAHARGVIHRDLKPANVMVGEFGEVYVMDWGLARILGREDFHGEELSPQSAGTQVVSDRLDQRDISPGSTMFTMEGDVMGTPSYMPIEQARGEIEEMDERSDVYAIGAMLYHLLSGRRPYQADGEAPNAFTTLMRLLDGPPMPLHESGVGIPPELEAICEKAMSRDKDARYSDMRELAGDLRSYLEGRVVAAYQTGAVAELKMWVRRNRSLARSLVAGVLVLVAGVVTSTYYWNESSEQAASVLRLEDTRNLELLWAEGRELWPARPERRQDLQDWIARAEVMLARMPEHEATLAQLQEQALPRTEEEILWDRINHPDREALEKHINAIPSYEASIAAAENEEVKAVYRQRRARSLEIIEEATVKVQEGRITWRFEDSQTEWWHAALQNLIWELEVLRDKTTWGVDPDGRYRCGISEVVQRLAMVDAIERETLTGEGAAGAWDEACRSIADESASPAYKGLKLTPQWGLLPIGEDPETGLWEFAHVQSGDAPAREAATGTLSLSKGSGIVFVLVPAGTFWMGAQAGDAAGENFDPEAGPEEGPVHEVSLDAFFLAKHEMTQAQWLRVAYDKPSRYRGDIEIFKDRSTGEVTGRITQMHPVERVTWSECDHVTGIMDLLLPTEAQWEYAARAGTSTPWWTGSEPETLEGAENLCDSTTRAIGEAGWTYEEWSDGYPAHAPVDAFKPNPWGFHNILGNVGEWTRDRHLSSAYLLEVAGGAGERVMAGQGTSKADRSIRGPGWFRASTGLRVSARYSADEREYKTQVFGLRPSRAIEG